MNSDDPLLSRLRVLRVRDESVLLDSDLAALYAVETKAFNQAIRRNAHRFPRDFAFQLTEEEWTALRSQIVTLKPGSRGQHRKYVPWVFTEHGAIMAASVLNSDRAVEMSVYVVRAFVQLRVVLLDHKVLAEKLAALERRVSHHDNSLAEVIDAIRALMAQPKPANRPIGFTADVTGKPVKR